MIKDTELLESIQYHRFPVLQWYVHVRYNPCTLSSWFTRLEL